jgi:hypothetical protein
MTITNCDILQSRIQGTPLEYGFIVPIDQNTVTVELLQSSSLAYLVAGNVFNLGKLFNITQIGTGLRNGQPTQLFQVTLPTS